MQGQHDISQGQHEVAYGCRGAARLPAGGLCRAEPDSGSSSPLSRGGVCTPAEGKQWPLTVIELTLVSDDLAYVKVGFFLFYTLIATATKVLQWNNFNN